MGDLGLEPEDYVELTKDLKDLANAHCGGRLVSMLEGGYHLEQLAEQGFYCWRLCARSS